MTPALTFRNIKARIPSWSCEAGERTILVAPTGWGKTIWLKQLALLRDAEATSILWHGKLVTADTAARFRSRWIYVPQFLFRSGQTAERHVTSLLRLQAHASLNPGDTLDRLRESLRRIGLGNVDIKKRALHELSGGELQALALVRSVLLCPEGLLLDEPTSAMDTELSQRVEAWVRSEFTGACVWVSHNQDQVERLKSAGFSALRP